MSAFRPLSASPFTAANLSLLVATTLGVAVRAMAKADLGLALKPSPRFTIAGDHFWLGPTPPESAASRI